MPIEDLIYRQISELLARSFAVRDAVAYLIAIEARRAKSPEQVFTDVAGALQDRLDELPEGISDLKERVRAESDWIVGAAQAFHRLRKQ